MRTDLEQAQAIVDELGWAANAGRRSLAILAQALAAGRREGYEEAAKEYVEARRQVYESGAEQMRERAAQCLLNGSFLHDEAPAARLAREAAAAIRALPLTPEEPK